MIVISKMLHSLFLCFWTFICNLACVPGKAYYDKVWKLSFLDQQKHSVQCVPKKVAGCDWTSLILFVRGFVFHFWKSRKDLWLLVSVMTIKSFRCLLLTWHNKNYFLILDLCFVGTRYPLVMSFLQLSSRIIRPSIEFVLNLLC